MTDVYKAIRTVSPERYGMSMNELRQILDHCGGSKADIAWDAFLFGFLKGQRAAAKQREALDTEAACERHIITTWLDIHKNDASLLRTLRIHALALGRVAAKTKEGTT